MGSRPSSAARALRAALSDQTPLSGAERYLPDHRPLPVTLTARGPAPWVVSDIRL